MNALELDGVRERVRQFVGWQDCTCGDDLHCWYYQSSEQQLALAIDNATGYELEEKPLDDLVKELLDWYKDEL